MDLTLYHPITILLRHLSLSLPLTKINVKYLLNHANMLHHLYLLLPLHHHYTIAISV